MNKEKAIEEARKEMKRRHEETFKNDVLRQMQRISDLSDQLRIAKQELANMEYNELDLTQ